MDFSALAIPAVILIAVTSIILAVGRDWRLSISALGAQYIGMFVLIVQSWPLELAVVKLVAGWISAAVLGMALVGVPVQKRSSEESWLSEILFRIFPAVLVGLVVISLAPGISQWFLTATYGQILGGAVLICMGILHLGLTGQPWRTTVGLLTIFAGFEILYATVETSILITGVLTLANMGIALVGAYLLLSPSMEVEE